MEQDSGVPLGRPLPPLSKRAEFERLAASKQIQEHASILVRVARDALEEADRRIDHLNQLATRPEVALPGALENIAITFQQAMESVLTTVHSATRSVVAGIREAAEEKDTLRSTTVAPQHFAEKIAARPAEGVKDGHRLVEAGTGRYWVASGGAWHGPASMQEELEAADRG